ncbi:MAG: hypothetical protein ABSC11_02990 [Smithella sp.]|jgi:hypothetical protein
MSIDIIIAITGAIALIPATWIPLYIYRARRFDAACDTFRAAFDNELAFLISDTKPISSVHGTTYAILKKALNDHRNAVNVFRLVLPKGKRRGFDKAWDNYLYPEDHNKENDPLLDYLEYSSDDFETRKFAHSNLINLLSFAEPK